jgi:hypothetical protein
VSYPSAQPVFSTGGWFDDAKSHRMNPLFVGGFDFTRPPPEITKDGVKHGT